MVVFSMRVATAPGHRRRLVSVIAPLVAPTRVEPGCEGCRLYVDADDATALTMVQEWSSQAALERYLLSDVRKLLIATMEMSTVAPMVRFDTIERRDGIEVITHLLERGEVPARAASSGGHDRYGIGSDASHQQGD